MDNDRLKTVLGRTRAKALALARQHEDLREVLEPILVVQELLEMLLRQQILESEGRAKTRATALGRILIAKGVLTADELGSVESELETRSTVDQALDDVLQAQREWVDRLLDEIKYGGESRENAPS